MDDGIPLLYHDPYIVMFSLHRSRLSKVLCTSRGEEFVVDVTSNSKLLTLKEICSADQIQGENGTFSIVSHQKDSCMSSLVLNNVILQFPT